MSIDLSQFHQTFLEESFEGLEQMESCLLELEKGGSDDETINTIFRAAHSIKGGSGTFGFEDIASFTHVLETLLDEMRSGERKITGDAIALLLQSVDCVRDMLTAAQDDGEADKAHISGVQASLEAMLAGEASSEAPVPVRDNAPAASTASAGWHIRFSPHRHILKTGNDPLRLLRELEALGDVSVRSDRHELPVLTDMDAEECYLDWDIDLKGDVEQQAISEIFEWVEDDCDLAVEPLDSGPCETASVAQPEKDEIVADDGQVADAGAQKEITGQSEVKADTPRTARKSAESGSIRVGIDKVDMLINMVGELVITQSMLGQLN